MNKYTIYCTSEQTKKALNLGAQLTLCPIKAHLSDEGCEKVHVIKTINDGYETYYVIPTTEQLIGWLEEKGILIEIYYNSTYKHYNYCKKYGGRGNWGCALYDSYTKGFSSRKEATLAAIDAAIEYLSNNKK